jgi:hypothetical protein
MLAGFLGGGSGDTTSQQGAKFDLLRNVRTSLHADEQKVIGSTPDVGMIP